MRYRTRLILLFGFGTLVILVGVLGYSAFHRAEQIYTNVVSIHEAYRESTSLLSEIDSDRLVSAIMVRDYLLDPLPASAPQYRKDLLELKSSMEKHLEGLFATIGREENDTAERLRQETNAYWESVDPIFDWTPEEKAVMSFKFLRKEVLPRRQAILSLTREIDALNARNLRSEQQKIGNFRDELRTYSRNMFFFSLVFSFVVAAMSSSRISNLEQHWEKEKSRAEEAERELRQLSQKLVQTQEEERKSISRELHDEIGQMVTGLRMELTNIQMLRTGPETEFVEHMSEAKTIAERTLHSVRNLAMGLRPSMLDDLGLGPALQWQAKEFSRRSGVPATVELEGNLEALDEGLRTCLYRVVQESLTNCARHARAKSIVVFVSGESERVTMKIQDDGIGFDLKALENRGLGLIGMEERVREAGGVLEVKSEKDAGTLVTVEIPLKKGVMHA
jgi:signal transduction histidine kinase